MAKALISPNEKVKHISSWNVVTLEDSTNEYRSVESDIENSQRICQIEELEFLVADPLFWVECNSSVTVNDYYYDSSDNTIKPIIHADKPS